MIDKKKIEAKIEEISRRRNYLEDYKEKTFEEFTSNESIIGYDFAVFSLQRAIQSAVDIAKHICASKNRRIPDKLKDLFEELFFLKILRKDLAIRLGKAVGLRNIIVHEYEKVDPNIVYSIIQKNLSDFDNFILSIDEFLKKEEDVKMG